MKKLLFIFLLIPIFCFAQEEIPNFNTQDTVKKVIGTPQIKNQLISTNFTESRDVYCELVGTQKMLSTKVTIDIDFGENRKFAEDKRLRDESGNLIVFNSMIDALNFMGGLGWKLHSTMLISGQYGSVYHFILVKTIPKDEK
jgi:hypothetical protein